MVANVVFSETALKIFLIFCMKLGDYKGRKVTESYFWKKVLDLEILAKGLQIRPKPDTLIFGWLAGNAVFSETYLRIFLIFCMKLRDYKGIKVTEPNFWKKFLIWRYLQKGLQISTKSMMSSCFLIYSPVQSMYSC